VLKKGRGPLYFLWIYAHGDIINIVKVTKSMLSTFKLKYCFALSKQAIFAKFRQKSMCGFCHFVNFYQKRNPLKSNY